MESVESAAAAAAREGVQVAVGAARAAVVVAPCRVAMSVAAARAAAEGTVAAGMEAGRCNPTRMAAPA